MADAPLTSSASPSAVVALDLRNPVVHAAVARLLEQGGLTVTSDTEQAALLLTDQPGPPKAVPTLVLGDDLPWPVHPRLLLDKIKALLSHRPQRLGRWLFDLQVQVLRDTDGQVVVLTSKEAAILSLLLEAGEPVSRDELLSAVWGYEEGLDTHTLETHIYRLRRKLEDDDATLLLTDARGGYALSASAT